MLNENDQDVVDRDMNEHGQNSCDPREQDALCMKYVHGNQISEAKEHVTIEHYCVT
jgi:hypothetical protein